MEDLKNIVEIIKPDIENIYQSLINSAKQMDRIISLLKKKYVIELPGISENVYNAIIIRHDRRKVEIDGIKYYFKAGSGIDLRYLSVEYDIEIYEIISDKYNISLSKIDENVMDLIIKTNKIEFIVYGPILLSALVVDDYQKHLLKLKNLYVRFLEKYLSNFAVRVDEIASKLSAAIRLLDNSLAEQIDTLETRIG